MREKAEKFFIFVTVLGVLDFFPSFGHALEPRITDFLITNDMENVLVYARLANGFTHQMELAVLAGLPAVFTMSVEVYEKRAMLWDRKLVSRDVKRTLKYDSLKKIFSVGTDGEEPAIFHDFESAQRAMSDFNGIVAVPMSFLAKGRNYYVMIRIKMSKVRLPLHMEYVFFFVSMWDFETPWYKQNFTY